MVKFSFELSDESADLLSEILADYVRKYKVESFLTPQGPEYQKWYAAHAQAAEEVRQIVAKGSSK